MLFIFVIIVLKLITLKHKIRLSKMLLEKAIWMYFILFLNVHILHLEAISQCYPICAFFVQAVALYINTCPGLPVTQLA